MCAGALNVAAPVVSCRPPWSAYILQESEIVCIDAIPVCRRAHLTYLYVRFAFFLLWLKLGLEARTYRAALSMVTVQLVRVRVYDILCSSCPADGVTRNMCFVSYKGSRRCVVNPRVVLPPCPCAHLHDRSLAHCSHVTARSVFVSICLLCSDLACLRTNHPTPPVNPL